MKITFERSGGVANMRIDATIDTATLPPEETESLQQLIDRARFFELPTNLLPSITKPDVFHYRITIDSNGRQHSVETSDDSAPDTMQPLLERLTRLARTAR